MPRSINGDTKRRNSLTHVRSLDDTTISYRSTPEYLRKVFNNSSSTPRTVRSRRNSTNESIHSTTIVNGNPKYKAQEDYYDEVHSLKKDLKSLQIENSHLTAKIRRLEEDNTRKRKELDEFYHSYKDDKGRRASSTSFPERSNSLMNLKQKLFKLEMQLKQKETIIDEMKRDPRWSRSNELEIQTRALLQEIERQKFLHATQIRDDYNASLKEEQINAIRQLNADKMTLIAENESLKKKIDEGNLHFPAECDEKIHRLKEESKYYQNEFEQMKNDWKQMRRERDKFIDKFDYLNEQFEDMKRQRDEYRRKCRDTNEIIPKKNERRSKMKTLYDDDVREFRQNHAAKVIQRQWKIYRRTSRSKTNRVNVNRSDLYRSSHEGNLSRDNALKIIQAALRGLIRRTEIRSIDQHVFSSSNENHRIGSTHSKQFDKNEWKSMSFDRSHSSRNSLIKSKTSGKLSTVRDDDDIFYS